MLLSIKKITSPLAIFLFILTLCNCRHIKPSDEIIYDQSNSILWEKDHPPVWQDFKGIPKPYWTSDAGAMTACLLDYKRTYHKDSIIIKVKALFLKDSSWARRGSMSNYLLNHERGHFDIGEIQARLIREYLSHWEGNGIESFETYVNIGYSTAWQNTLSAQYDFETDRSRNREQQAIWNRRIDSLLAIYEPFKDTMLVLPLHGRH